MFNHLMFADPAVGDTQVGLGVDPTTPSTFGVVSSQGSIPRHMQFGLRFTF
ncbi:MAG TPA: hypothetical protein VE077_21190 [Candidatus Methylomirabilis sp.]|nr:hypothetical protein [Candidatus Methylomirabilis sp.]